MKVNLKLASQGHFEKVSARSGSVFIVGFLFPKKSAAVAILESVCLCGMAYLQRLGDLFLKSGDEAISLF